ncbi:MAG TPA: serpin family protein, partial [Acidobacteriaceae bacterium]|nr:serpin family protein [Acidobacteriaceae bacterium]
MKLLLSLIVACLLLALNANGTETKSVTDGDRATVVQGNNAFAVALYDQLGHQAGNLFFSPESISTALAMAYAGARGNTATEMAKALHFTLPPTQLDGAMGALLRDLNAAHSEYQLNVANALWAQQGYTFLDQFLNLLKTDYGAGLQQLDFQGAPEAARSTINQ